MAVTTYALQVSQHKDKDTAYNMLKSMAIACECRDHLPVTFSHL